MKNFVALCICAFTLLACNADEAQKTAAEKPSQGTAPVQKADADTMTDAQVFAYILGDVYGMPIYMNMPQRIGALLDLDAMIQGIVDNERALVDSSWVLQLSAEEQAKVNDHFANVMKEREQAGENAKPIELAGPITGQKVILMDTTSMIVKYSYAQGVSIDLLFDGMRKSFGEDFEGRFFIQGVRESIYAKLDTSFKKRVSDDRLMAVNIKYKKRMQEIREEQRRQ